ncbi:MAG: hypothetical protein AAGB01_09640 [Cyanobacteria bacterium P01_F01_bin.42]
MNSLKQQVLWVLLGIMSATVLLGVVLSLIVNYGLQQFEEQPDMVLPINSNSLSVP